MLNYADVCREAINIANGIKLDIPKPTNIIFAGVGGSGIAGSLVKDVVQDSVDVPIEIVRGYTLPNYVNKNSLVICVSYSGNTEETLSQFVEAVKRKCCIVSISSGGKLVEWSKKLDIPLIQVPVGYQPRETIPYLFFSLIACLEKIGLRNFSQDKNELLNTLPQIDLSKIDELATKIKDSIPVIYGSSDFSGVLRRIKNELNENSKMLAKFEEFPELNHNEIVGYELFGYPNVSVVFLRDKDEKEEISKRIETTKEILSGKVKNINEMWAYGSSRLSKVMSLVYQAAYLSLKLAELKGIDWKQTKTIDKVKEEIKSLGVREKLEGEINSLVK